MHNTHPCTGSTPQCKCAVASYTSCPGINPRSRVQVRSFYVIFHWLIVNLNMAEEQWRQPKRLLTGARVSGPFGDFYDNPDPNIRRRKRLRIYGIVTGACGERKYTVQFDSGQVLECFSNTLRLETATASLPPEEVQAAVADVEAEGNHAEEAARIIQDNEAAANDGDEEHLPQESPEAEDEEGAEDQADAASACSATDEAEPAQRPVGTVEQAPTEDSTMYAGRKQAALRRIAGMKDQVVVINSGRSLSLEWKVVAESKPDIEEDDDISELGLKNLEDITRVQYNILIAHLFLKLTFRVSLSCLLLFCFYFCILTTIFCFFFIIQELEV
jgi:hypothetical protein